MTKEQQIKIQRCIDEFYSNRPQVRDELGVALQVLYEAEPKHGRWIWNKRLGEWYCSNCDRIMTPYTVEKSEGEYEMAQPFYCGWCGAKMDGGENETDR